jgi:hypothetical protein
MKRSDRQRIFVSRCVRKTPWSIVGDEVGAPDRGRRIRGRAPVSGTPYNYKVFGQKWEKSVEPSLMVAVSGKAMVK